MSELYKRIQDLCLARGESVGKMCNSLGISRGNLTELKMGRIKTLKTENLSKIAKYLDVTVDYLLGNEEKPATETSDELDNEFFAFYGEVKPYFDEDDINDIKIFMKMKAEYKKKKNDKG